MRARLLKVLLSLPFLVAVGLFGFYLVFGFFLVDPLAKKILPWVGEEKLASRLSLDKVEFNPLTLEATVSGLKLAENNGRPLAGFERLYLNLESQGLFRFAWRLKEVQLTGPHAEFAVRKGGKFNWAELIAKLNEDKTPPSDTLPRVLIDHIRIEKGDVEYTDANRPGEPFHVHLQPLGMELDGLSTLPEDRGDYVIAAKLPDQGGTLKWKGEVSLNPVKSDGEVALEGVRLTKLLRVIKTPRNFELPSGTLAASTRYRFAMVRTKSAQDKSGQDKSGQDQPWLQLNGANLILQNLVLAPRGGGAPVFELAEAKVGNANLDLYAQRLDIAEVSFKGGRLAVTREQDGRLDWQKLFAVAPDVPPPPPRKATARPAAAAPWKLAVHSIRAEDWSARYTDNTYLKPLRIEAADFGLSAALAGEFGSTPAIRVGPLNAGLGPVKLFSAEEEVAELGGVKLANADFDLAAKHLAIEAVDLSAFATTLSLGKDKQLNWSGILAKPPAPDQAVPKPAAPDAAASAAADKPTAFSLSLGRLGVEGVQVAVSDHSTPRPVRLDIVDGHASVKDLDLDPNKPLMLQAGFKVGQGGSFDASGSVVPGKASGRLELKLADLALRPFAPYVSQFARLDLQSGAASTRGWLEFARGGKGMKLDYLGGFAVSNLAIVEERTAAPFLGWAKLASNNMAVSLSPNRLQIKELMATRPFGKIIIFEDKSLNLQRILRKQPAASAKAAPPKAAAAEVFPVTIGRLRVNNADLEFADLSLTPQFGTRMHSLSGVINGLSSDPATTAQVELDGSVDDFGSARVRGSIQPFRATDFTDLTLTFRNLEMANLTPYSGKFAGRKIDSGKLSVDLEYKIKNRQLASKNKFVINKVKLGERVDSPDALKLPLDLAIAVLQDSNGVIDVDIPITGSLDDPQFSYGRIVWKAIVNLLTKIVTAPFRALGKLLGISAEKLEAINFDPGSDRLLPPEREKLKTLAEALAKRPALNLTLEPGFDPVADRRALQELEIRREAVAVAGIKLAPGELPGPVDVNNYKIQTWLEDRYEQVAGRAEYEKLRSNYKGKDAGVAARVLESEFVERLGRQFKTRDSGPVSAFHAELQERLTQQVKIEDKALTELAQARGQAMREGILGFGLEPGRVSIGAPSQQTVKDKLVPSKMSLGTASDTAAAPSQPAAAQPAAP